MQIPSCKRGFTLIELSIVLVIIGFITAGVIVGRSLIRQSQVMSVITDENSYVKAAFAFRDKYNALPGDMKNATAFWGTNPNGCPLNGSGASTFQAATCNGDGNGLIDGPESVTSYAPTMWEEFTAWQQLADAGFISGTYTGTSGPAGTFDHLPGVNVPASKLPGTGFEWIAYTPAGASAQNGDIFGPFDATAASNYQQYLWYGGVYTNLTLQGPALSGTEAASIDSKIDDGLPNTGQVMAGRALNAGFASLYCANAVGPSGVYPATNSNNCLLLFQVNW